MVKIDSPMATPSEREEYVHVLLDFLREAGKIAMGKLWTPCAIELKCDASPVTSADLEISALAKKYLAPYISRSDTFLLDEEDKESLAVSPDEVLRHRLLWILDPIDGTRLFANHLPFFSISLGVFKDGKPWIGGVYFPALRELFYSDGLESFFVQEAFLENALKEEILPVPCTLSRQKYFFCTEKFLKTFRLNFSPCKILASGSATADLCFPSIGRVCGSIFQAHVWDFAGAFPVFLSAGFQLWNFSTGHPLLSLRASDFVFDEKIPWKLKDMHVLAMEQNFQLIQKKMVKKWI